jgi:pimeloyl-ACP methyl ester carboxylesterase
MLRFALYFLLSLFLLLTSACQQPEKSAEPQETEESAKPVSVAIESDGLQLRGRFFPARGQGLQPTLLLIPGWPGNPEDVLGMGVQLMGRGINLLMVNPRGMHESEGTNTFVGTLRDIGASLRWLRSDSVAEAFQIDGTEITLGGYSWGGGMAMAYAAADPDVGRVVSIAGTDHGEFIRELQRNEAMASEIRAMLLSTRAPEGPVRFDVESGLRELAEGQEIFGLRENAAQLSNRRILLIGGWDDTGVTVDQHLLPLYRALKGAGAKDVTFLVYHDDHGFGQVREQMAADIGAWVKGSQDR